MNGAYLCTTRSGDKRLLIRSDHTSALGVQRFGVRRFPHLHLSVERCVDVERSLHCQLRPIANCSPPIDLPRLIALNPASRIARLSFLACRPSALLFGQ